MTPGYAPRDPGEWDADREFYTGGMLKEYTKAVAEAEQEVNDALDRRDVNAFLHWSKELSRMRVHLDHAGDEHVKAQLRILDKPEVEEA